MFLRPNQNTERNKKPKCTFSCKGLMEPFKSNHFQRLGLSRSFFFFLTRSLKFIPAVHIWSTWGSLFIFVPYSFHYSNHRLCSSHKKWMVYLFKTREDNGSQNSEVQLFMHISWFINKAFHKLCSNAALSLKQRGPLEEVWVNSILEFCMVDSIPLECKWWFSSNMQKRINL